MITKLDSVKTTNHISKSLIIFWKITKDHLGQSLFNNYKEQFSRLLLDYITHQNINLETLFGIGFDGEKEDCKIINPVVIDDELQDDGNTLIHIRWNNNPESNNTVGFMGFGMPQDTNTILSFEVPTKYISIDNVFNWDMIEDIVVNRNSELKSNNVLLHETSKILYEFFEPIRDGRVNWR